MLFYFPGRIMPHLAQRPHTSISPELLSVLWNAELLVCITSHTSLTLYDGFHQADTIVFPVQPRQLHNKHMFKLIKKINQCISY